MPDFKQPSEIAREALRRLAAMRTPPTPDNYRALYHEIAGTAQVESFPEKALRNLAASLPRETPKQAKFVQQFTAALTEKSWPAVTQALRGLLSEAEGPVPAWAALIRDLLSQLERRHGGLTQAQKRDAVQHVLQSSGADPAILFERLNGLVSSWSRSPEAEAAGPLAEDPQAPDPAAAGALSAQPPRPEAVVDLRELVAQLLQSTTGILLIDTPELANEAAELAAQARRAADGPALVALARRIKQYVFRLQFVAEDQIEIKQGLQNLLMLVVENVSELVADDQWLQGQIAVVLESFAQPLNIRRLEEVERRLKEVIYKQGLLKHSLMDAKERLRSMLAGFVDHLSAFSDSTSGYHDTIERCAQRISSAKNLSELNLVLDEVMRETRIIQLNAQRSRDELRAVKSRVDEANQEIERLQRELAQTSELVRHDQLTGALNRKGLEEAFDREHARARRRRSPMCIALLDVDNFKQLNDTYGHQTGDAALMHLASVIRESLRPNDTIARYGGEEFLLLLPDTRPEEALKVMQRLQRELTRRFFLAENQKLLITFSAGVTVIDPGEDRNQALKRADGAMYQAKREGKNRVALA